MFFFSFGDIDVHAMKLILGQVKGFLFFNVLCEMNTDYPEIMLLAMLIKVLYILFCDNILIISENTLFMPNCVLFHSKFLIINSSNHFVS